MNGEGGGSGSPELPRKKREDFSFDKIIGEGSYSTVSEMGGRGGERDRGREGGREDGEKGGREEREGRKGGGRMERREGGKGGGREGSGGGKEEDNQQRYSKWLKCKGRWRHRVFGHFALPGGASNRERHQEAVCM